VGARLPDADDRAAGVGEDGHAAEVATVIGATTVPPPACSTRAAVLSASSVQT
jgi:hypothetical protein